ncbi:MAG: hypothetical protein OEZ39_10990 [Gammaproteobacteria bacterium]|nr:hypothetical protein [Gammaproteobacteria bacterium]MDH5652370.1 hypothetical protein [Gammaproteobacteria bacterium]
MKFILGLDYELFFGSRTGTVQNCLIRPIDELLKVTNRYGVRLSLFVDAGYLLRAAEYPALQAEVDRIKQQLSELSKQGHDIQLHVHPHWLDCHYADGEWRIDTTRYRLHDFATEEIHKIVADQTKLLADISGKPVFAYRAGGWCIQPFTALKDALWDAGIWLDSTVYFAGVSTDTVRGYDFSRAGTKSHWRFENDPVEEEPDGRFVEIPISACKLYPGFFWKMALVKKFAGNRFKPWGDGRTMIADSAYYLQRLTRPTYSVVSIDGLKAATLASALRQNRRWGNSGIFNIMGHPKSLTPYSMQQLERFLRDHHTQLEPITFQDLAGMKAVATAG